MFCALKLGSFGCVTREQKLVNAECSTCRAAAHPCLCQLHSLILHRKQLLLNPSPYGLEAVGVVTPKESPRAGASTKRWEVVGCSSFLGSVLQLAGELGLSGVGGEVGLCLYPCRASRLLASARVPSSLTQGIDFGFTDLLLSPG